MVETRHGNVANSCYFKMRFPTDALDFSAAKFRSLDPPYWPALRLAL
jgi:hypothetical protein